MSLDAIHSISEFPVEDEVSVIPTVTFKNDKKLEDYHRLVEKYYDLE
jgi:hypothetical protein